MTLADLLAIGNQVAQRGRAIGQGGSRNPFALMGYGQGRPTGLGQASPEVLSRVGGFGQMPGMDQIRQLAGLPPWMGPAAKAAVTMAGHRAGMGLTPAPAPIRTPFFSNDWSGMQRAVAAQRPTMATLAQLAGYGAEGY